jgi:integrase
MPHKPEGRVFQGPRGGRAKPDSIRVILIRDVIRPLAKKFPSLRGGVSFDKGRIHSFRHYFCSMAAQQNIPEATLMLWLGHQHSSMIRHYYNLHDEQAQTEMRRLESIIPPISQASTPPAPPATTDPPGDDKANPTD